MRQDDIDYTKQAAYFLRDAVKPLRIEIGSSHAHMLVAAALRYGSRRAMLDDPNCPYVYDQWLSGQADCVDGIRDAISKMRDASLSPDQAPMIAQLIQDGLTPACMECGTIDSRNMPIGAVRQGDEAEWVCMECASDRDNYGHCRCCGEEVLYEADQLDENGLCEEHEGEFDLDPEEEEDWESYIENIQKDD